MKIEVLRAEANRILQDAIVYRDAQKAINPSSFLSGYYEGKAAGLSLFLSQLELVESSNPIKVHW